MQLLESGSLSTRENQLSAATYTYGTPSPFPPSFEGNPFAYGFGLFGDVVSASLALTLLLTYLFEARRSRQVNHLVDNYVVNNGLGRWTPLFLYRATIISLLSFVVMRSLPEAVWMLAWGEVPESTIRFLLALDLISTSAALIPLFFAVLCWCWGRQVIAQLLVIEVRAGITGGPPWPTIWKNARIVLVVVLIAIGVTIGKATA